MAPAAMAPAATLALMVRGYVATYTSSEGWACTENGLARRLNDGEVTTPGASLAEARLVAEREYGMEHVVTYVEPKSAVVKDTASAPVSASGIDAPAGAP